MRRESWWGDSASCGGPGRGGQRCPRTETAGAPSLPCVCVCVCVFLYVENYSCTRKIPTTSKIKTPKETESDRVKTQFPTAAPGSRYSVTCFSRRSVPVFLFSKPSTLFQTTVYLKVSNCILKVKSKGQQGECVSILQTCNSRRKGRASLHLRRRARGLLSIT